MRKRRIERKETMRELKETRMKKKDKEIDKKKGRDGAKRRSSTREEEEMK